MLLYSKELDKFRKQTSILMNQNLWTSLGFHMRNIGSEKSLVSDEKCDNESINFFYKRENFYHLKSSRFWTIDGTFKIVSKNMLPILYHA